jgi:hypothetical protein
MGASWSIRQSPAGPATESRLNSCFSGPAIISPEAQGGNRRTGCVDARLCKLLLGPNGGGGFSVSVYEDEVGARENVRVARDWIAKNGQSKSRRLISERDCGKVWCKDAITKRARPSGRRFGLSFCCKSAQKIVLQSRRPVAPRASEDAHAPSFAAL